ncbi:MAG TPA: TetR/AcrR family transcriptional regulator [Hyphomicrobiaceae bacterium]|nr:TetR/AcrR family transcriptional regulator [Hyphomicrobiaceae bacterium]
MRTEAREERRKEIAAAALALLEAHGYAGTTMQAVAKRAGASMETLYNWYGDKTGLFRALVSHNATEVRDMLEAHAGDGHDAIAVLEDLGPRLLALVTGETAIALNRAAATDQTGELGSAIASAGRETIGPMVEALFRRANDAGQLAIGDAQEATEIYFSLLIGDLQVRRVIGQLKPLTKAQARKRSERATTIIRRLYGPA